MKYFRFNIIIVLLSIFIINIYAEDKWEPIDSPSDNFGMSMFVNSTNILFLGTGEGIFWSSDKGQNWNNATCANGWAHSIFDFTEDSKGRVYASAASGVFVSTDKGNLWYMIKDDYMVMQVGIDELDYLYITSSTQDGKFKLNKSTDKGQTWIEITPQNKTIDFLSLCVQKSTMIILSIGNSLLYSTDGGMTWEQSAEVDEVLTFNSIISSNNSIIGNSLYQNINKGIFESIDGKSWHKISTIPEVIDFSWLKYNSFSKSVLGYNSIKGIYESDDNGKTWININEGIPDDAQIFDIATGKDGYLYATGSDYKIYRRKSNINSIDEHEKHDKNEINIYPNPISDYLIVEIGYNDLTAIKIEIFDLNGIKILDVDNQYQKKNIINISAQNIQTGPYYLKIQLNNRILIKPFVVVK
jgi:photosystem II stability/assembly factor-like uncharacterized protein